MLKLLFIFSGLLFILTGCTNQENSNNENNTNIKYSKISKNIENYSNSANNSILQNNISVTKNANPEEEIAFFSTKIYIKDPGRQQNISITCSTLDGTTIKPGETFSFCDTVGKATTEKGYKEADIYDAKGNKVKGLRWR